MSKILKSVTLGDVKNGGIFRALGKEFVKLDADEHGCLVLAKDIWTRMPFRDGDDPECPNDLRRSEIMPYLGNCLAEFTKNGTPLSTFIPLRIDLQDTTGQNEYGIFEVRIGLLTLRGYGKYWRLIPKVDAPWWLATPYGTPNCSPYTGGNDSVWYVFNGDVKRLVKIELAAANKKFRMFAGPHEGAGIIQEEVVEAAKEMNGLRRELNAMWIGVYSNNPQISTKGVYDRAVALAVEAIQAAAMARKFERSQRRHWPGAKEPHYGEGE